MPVGDGAASTGRGADGLGRVLAGTEVGPRDRDLEHIRVGAGAAPTREHASGFADADTPSAPRGAERRRPLRKWQASGQERSSVVLLVGIVGWWVDEFECAESGEWPVH